MSTDVNREIDAILGDWTDVRARWTGKFFTIAGQFRGKLHSGSRVDGVALARDMDALARAELEPAEPMLEPMHVAPLEYPAVDEPPELDAVEPEVIEPEATPPVAGAAASYEFLPAREGYAHFNPPEWKTLAEARAALTRRVEDEHGARTASRQIHLDRAFEIMLSETPDDGQKLELRQHREWALQMRLWDETRADLLAKIANLATLADARAYAAAVDAWWDT